MYDGATLAPRFQPRPGQQVHLRYSQGTIEVHPCSPGIPYRINRDAVSLTPVLRLAVQYFLGSRHYGAEVGRSRQEVAR